MSDHLLDELADERDDARRELYSESHPAGRECEECGSECWGDDDCPGCGA